jgi:apolipoprotein N-acyltransferase
MLRIKDKKKNDLIIDNTLWLIWAVFYGFAFPVYNLSFTVWFIFIPVFVYAYIKPVFQTAVYAFFYSLLYFAISFFWIYGFWLPAVFLILPIYAVFYSVFFICTAIIGKKLKKIRFIAVPMLWVSCELLRSAGFHGLIWNFLGNSQWKYPVIIQSADIFGVWGISFLILLINSAAADLICTLIDKKSVSKAFGKNILKLSITIALFLANLAYGLVSFNYYRHMSLMAPKEKLALIQPDIDSHDPWWEHRWINYGIIWKLNAEASLQNPDMIVWAESTVRTIVWYYLNNYGPDEEVNRLNIRFVKMPEEFNVPIIMCAPAEIDGKYYNSADYLDPATNVYQDNSKIHLVPFGEWMPGYDSLPFVKDIMNIEGAGSYTPSQDFNVIKSRKSSFRVLICYEDQYASLARQFIKKGINYFVNSTDAGWAYRQGFRHPMAQMLAGSILTAVSVRRPIARATNTGETGIVDITGIFDGGVGDYQRGFYIGDISIIDSGLVSIYTRFGYFFPYIISLFAAACLGFAVIKEVRGKV